MISRRNLFIGTSSLMCSVPMLSLARLLSPPSSFIGDSVFDRIVQKAQNDGWTALPIGELIGRIGIELVGTPYVAYTLELDDHNEFCAINLLGLDCVTFFECSLNLARILKQGSPTKDKFIEAVRQTRYRRGVQRGYTSRLHYTSDWIWDNARKHTIEDLTPKLPGAQPFAQKVGYMSTNPSAYRQLKANPEFIPEIRRFEDQINARKMWFLPMAGVENAEPLLKTGDIVGITTTQTGIDVAHTGLCYRDDGGVLHFLDASSAKSKMKVTLETDFSKTIRWSTRNTGIMIARPLEVLPPEENA